MNAAVTDICNALAALFRAAGTLIAILYAATVAQCKSDREGSIA